MAQHWQPLGMGTSDEIRCFYADTTNNKLYVGGSFKYAGGVFVRSIATWNGYNWDSLGSGQINCTVNSCYPVLSITGYNNEIYVGEDFVIWEV